MSKVYRCENQACSLGTVGSPGRFRGGITAEQVTVLTGKPADSLKKGEDFGEGVCPNCGQKGVERTAESAQKEALAAAKAAYEAQVKAIKEGVA